MLKEKRTSKRNRNPTIRFTPGEGEPKKPKVNVKEKKKNVPAGKGRKAAKSKKKGGKETAPIEVPNPPPQLTSAGTIGPFIGGYSPFPGHTGFRHAAFTTIIQSPRYNFAPLIS